MALPARSERKFLQKELIPFSSGITRSFGNRGIMGNPDPVLLYIANNDERAYRIMERNDSAVKAGRQNRDNNLLNPGFSIRKGSSKSRGSKTLHEFTINWFKRIKKLQTFRIRSLDAMYQGFRPFENTFSEISFRSKPYLAPISPKEKNQENFRFTEQRDLAYFDRQKREYVIFENEIARLKWFIPSYGSLDIPQGVGIYQSVFLIYFAKSKFFEMFSQGMQRSLGMVKAKQTGFGGMVAPAASRATEEAANAQEVFSSVVRDITEIIEVLNSSNILVEKAGWTLDFLNNVSFADGWIKALDYVDKQITLIVASEILSFQEGKFGSRAQSVMHAESGNKTAMVDGGWFDSEWNDNFILPVLEYNFGEIDPDDAPKQISHCRIPLTLADVKTAYNMGMKLDADEIARRFYLPLADEDTTNILKLVKPTKTTGPNRENPGSNPKKQVQKQDEQTRRSN